VTYSRLALRKLGIDNLIIHLAQLSSSWAFFCLYIHLETVIATLNKAAFMADKRLINTRERFIIID